MTDVGGRGRSSTRLTNESDQPEAVLPLSQATLRSKLLRLITRPCPLFKPPPTPYQRGFPELSRRASQPHPQSRRVIHTIDLRSAHTSAVRP